MPARLFMGVVLIFLSIATAFGQVVGPVEVMAAVQHDESEELRQIPPKRPQPGQREIPVYRIPQALLPKSPDLVLQTQAGITASVGGLNFDGVGVGFTGPAGAFTPDAAPPDTNGAVGTTQYVQWVNESFAVFDKATGTPIYGPAAGNTLWTGFGGKCETNNDGDVIAQYDKAAHRWIMTQFSVSGGGADLQCVAISQTDDATGAYYRYAFSFNQFPDYPKLGVWPDAYYVTFNMFKAFYQGPRACAWNRARMLAGLSATQICFQLPSSVGSLLPSDLDGSTPPPPGSPNFIVTMGSNSLNLYKFHVDFAVPSNSTLSSAFNIPVASFSQACGGGACIPQSGTQQLLDSLADRLMYRLAYRNFGDHEALVVNHSVATAGGGAAIRWYELRNPGGTPFLYQQGTFAPDNEFRWMGSIAMDKVGNIAVGYSLSSSGRHPSIRYTVRAPGDALGQMGAETEIIAGGGSQTSQLNRWGDYSSMSVDPVDDCTFWYTQEYLKTNGAFNWSTRIASFKMDTCTTNNNAIAINVQTNPAGLQITVDSVNYVAPQSFNWVVGSSHTIATSTPQTSGGTRRNFANWSDGGAISHSVAPTVATTYTANFNTQYLLTTGVSPSGAGTVLANPSSADGFYDSGTSVQLTASANSGFTFSNWSGDVSGSTNPQSVSMTAPRNATAVFSVVGGAGLRFVPVTPCRVADTRNPNGPFGGPIISGNTSRDFTIPGSGCGIPATALGYSLNITVVPSGPLGFLTIWPSGQPRPGVMTLSSDGRIKANAAITGAGTGGAVSVYVSDTSHVILDINGYFTSPANAPAGLVFYPLPPCRVIDTRLANGPLGGPILAGQASRTVPVLSSPCGLPGTALAYSLNMTVVPDGNLDYLTTWPTGSPQPFVSTLNDNTGTVLANAAIVPAGTGGSIDVFVTQQTHLIIDVNGYFAPANTGGLLFYPLTPCRVVDTRNPAGPLSGPALNGQRDFNLLAGPCGVPAAVKAYALSATVMPSGFLGYLTLWPAGDPQPLVSTLNSYDASVVSNGAIVPTNTGAISAFSTDTTHLILDLSGVFAP
jgi:hypothetical protein